MMICVSRLRVFDACWGLGVWHCRCVDGRGFDMGFRLDLGLGEGLVYRIGWDGGIKKFIDVG